MIKQKPTRHYITGKTCRISYIGGKGALVPEMEVLHASKIAGRRKVAIGGHGDPMTFAQAEWFARGILKIIEGSKSNE